MYCKLYLSHIAFFIKPISYFLYFLVLIMSLIQLFIFKVVDMQQEQGAERNMAVWKYIIRADEGLSELKCYVMLNQQN